MKNKNKRHINVGQILFTGFLATTLLVGQSIPVFAATTIWEKANEIMKDVYNEILLISTIAAIVTASIALGYQCRTYGRFYACRSPHCCSWI